MTAIRIFLLLLSLTVSTATVSAFSSRSPMQLRTTQRSHSLHSSPVFLLRGGHQDQDTADIYDSETLPPQEPFKEEEVTATPTKGAAVSSVPQMLSSAVTTFGTIYGSALIKRPILTKSMTACVVFAISDYLAQRMEATKESTIQWKRLFAGALVGLLYFGPAAHYWYDAIFRLLPSTTFVSTLQKAALGQVFFGPSFTCIFFGVGLLQSGTFTPALWLSKIRQDLPGAWLAGAGF
jgi:protein Mpv17